MTRTRTPEQSDPPRSAAPPRPRTFDEALAAVGSAATAADLLGTDPLAAARRYRRLIRLLHPDTAPPGRAAEATAASAALNALNAARAGSTAPPANTVTTPHHRYTTADLHATGDLALLRRARAAPHRDPYTELDVLLKVPRSPADNDLIAREATALNRLARHGDPRFHAYAPTLVETFRYTDPADPAPHAVRQVNAVQRLDGFRPLTDLAAARPEGVDARDAAWIWRRLLVALGYAHRAGVRHGAVLPEHVMIHPELHGVVLVDWCYSVTGAYAPLPALVERHRDRYPPEVLAREPATEATDIHLASLCMAELMGNQAPLALRAFVVGSTLPDQRRRPHDAWKLLAELDDLLDRRYGPRTFRPLHLPNRAIPPN
ncbi:molecular chaperone DnaJ [Streptacidiphilus cavernicola]|uniref:Molecular chaperone DnaJ n=1 Tax=Streptacidiphilus cavernicola TaxID=3342716 RepID=A0ABV6VYH5_9ACTN